MKFASRKYELIYFTKSKRFNLKASIYLGRIEKKPKAEVHILGVWVDSKLKWSVYWRKVQKKASIQIRAFVQTTAST